MKFHAFMYVSIGRKREIDQGMAAKDSALYQRMLEEEHQHIAFKETFLLFG